jgi:hypothetical protein
MKPRHPFAVATTALDAKVAASAHVKRVVGCALGCRVTGRWLAPGGWRLASPRPSRHAARMGKDVDAAGESNTSRLRCSLHLSATVTLSSLLPPLHCLSSRAFVISSLRPCNSAFHLSPTASLHRCIAAPPPTASRHVHHAGPLWWHFHPRPRRRNGLLLLDRHGRLRSHGRLGEEEEARRRGRAQHVRDLPRATAEHRC